jgi:hypothetical protein
MSKAELQKLIESQMSHELVRKLLKVPQDGKTIELVNGGSTIRLRVTTASHDTPTPQPMPKFAIR